MSNLTSDQLSQVLLQAQSSDIQTRQTAERVLTEAEKDFRTYLGMLSIELSEESRPQLTRRLAGLLMKNALNARDNAKRVQLESKWVQLDEDTKGVIKGNIVKTLASPDSFARRTAAQVVSKIACIELPKNQWPQLMGGLLQSMNSSDNNLKEATLTCLGYICEEIDDDILLPQSNNILTAVCQGITSDQEVLKVAGLTALDNCIEFARNNFKEAKDTAYIMEILFKSCVDTSSQVKTLALACIVRIAQNYYHILEMFMQKLFNITYEIIQSGDEEPAMQAIEFWSTICEEEIFLDTMTEQGVSDKKSSKYIAGAMQFLVPLINKTLTKEEDDPEDDDEWDLPMAAGTCLSLMASTVRDQIVPHVLPFVEENINHSEWKNREAATMAFGAILDGPKEALLQNINTALPLFLSHMQDPSPSVKDTTAWTLGRICQFHPEAIGDHFSNLINVLGTCLSDAPRISTNVCWAIHNLGQAFDSNGLQTGLLSQAFPPLLQKLMETADRSDSSENHLRASAYEAVNVLIQTGADDTVSTTLLALPVFITRLGNTFNMQVLSNDDKDEQNELQGLLCGVLQVVTNKVGKQITTDKNDERMMELFLKVFQTRSATVHEEALMAVGAVANALENEFEKYLNHFSPWLLQGLNNFQEYQVCAVAVGVVGDIARALGAGIGHQCETIIGILLSNLENKSLNRLVYPPILSCFGDIALAIGGEFVKFLPAVMSALSQACGTTIERDDPDLVEFLNTLRESIFEAYTGIIQGLRSDHAIFHFKDYVHHVVGFVEYAYNDRDKSEAVKRGVVGVIGDLGHAFGSDVKVSLNTQAIRNIITDAGNSPDQATRDVVNWARDILSHL